MLKASDPAQGQDEYRAADALADMAPQDLERIKEEAYDKFTLTTQLLTLPADLKGQHSPACLACLANTAKSCSLACLSCATAELLQ